MYLLNEQQGSVLGGHLDIFKGGICIELRSGGRRWRGVADDVVAPPRMTDAATEFRLTLPPHLQVFIAVGVLLSNDTCHGGIHKVCPESLEDTSIPRHRVALTSKMFKNYLMTGVPLGKGSRVCLTMRDDHNGSACHLHGQAMAFTHRIGSKVITCSYPSFSS